ncbi:hypothetical protein RB195_003665 [Necator americanus]|uniref:Unspecific monooxygenase n=1 Tax=Necator americanus TaxID=51031 RepID=A0ABR1DPM9_NECAM
MFALLFFVTFIAVVFAHLLLRRAKLPPGPVPLPLIGNIPYLVYLAAVNGGIVGALRFLKKKYGSVFTVWFGPMPTVHIADFDIAQDAMVKHGANYSDRWVPMLFDVPRNGLGLIASNGKVWLDHRRFSLHTFRNFGFGRNIIEERIMEEFNLKFDAIDRQIQESGNSIVDAVPLFEVLVGSIINRLLFSERFDSSSDHFFAMKRKVDEIVSRVSFLDLFVYKFMLYLPILRKRYGQLLEPMFDLKDYLRRQLEQRKSDIKQGKHLLEEEGRDYVDAYLIKMAEEKAINEKETLFTEEALLVNLLDLWIAGQETTTTTIVSGLINLINYPEVVDKVRAEIKVVTGDNRPLSLQDRSSTPYLLATITEIQRLASILNLNLWRRSSEESNVGEFTIPAGTTITAQLSVLFSDEKHFKDPGNFDPSRYMNGGRLDQHVVPFGIGKRSCLGESLAKAELYLIIGNLIQRYALSSAGSLPSRDEKSPFGLLRRPKPFKFALSKIT